MNQWLELDLIFMRNMRQSPLRSGDYVKISIKDTGIGMDGKAALEEIRKLNRDIPFFVASGYGFTASIRKPFRNAELSEMLNGYPG